MGNQRVIGDDFAGIFCEHGNNFIFDLCQVDFLFVDENTAAVKINDETVCFKNMRLCALTVCCGEMADCGADAGKQFGSAERLCDIIICSCIECEYLFIFLRPCGDDDDRHGGPFANFFNDVHAVNIRQAEVEEQKIRTA